MINHAFQLDFFFPHLSESNRNISIFELPSTTFLIRTYKKNIFPFSNDSSNFCHSSEHPHKKWVLSYFSGRRRDRDHDIKKWLVILCTQLETFWRDLFNYKIPVVYENCMFPHGHPEIKVASGDPWLSNKYIWG